MGNFEKTQMMFAPGFRISLFDAAVLIAGIIVAFIASAYAWWAGMEINQFLRMVIPHPGFPNAGAQTYHFVTGGLDIEYPECKPSCYISRLLGKADRSEISATGRHAVAETARNPMTPKPKVSWIQRLVGWLLRHLGA